MGEILIARIVVTFVAVNVVVIVVFFHAIGECGIVITVVPVLNYCGMSCVLCLVPVAADDVRIQITACGLSPVIGP